MEVKISHNGLANNVKVSASAPNIIALIPKTAITIQAQLFRDGTNGKSAYQIALDNGYTGTEQQWINDLLLQNIDGGIIF